jgi:hypothetical protein
MMSASIPQRPNQANFYNVVCGGTWLNREQYAQAQADYKTNVNQFVDKQAQQSFMAWLDQADKMAHAPGNQPELSSANDSVYGQALTATVTLINTPTVRTRFSVIYTTINQNLQALFNTFKALVNPAMMSQLFVAQLANVQRSNDKYATRSDGPKTEKEREALETDLFEKNKSKFFTTHRVKETEETVLDSQQG